MSGNSRKRNRESPLKRISDYDVTIHQHLFADTLLMFNIQRKKERFDQCMSYIYSKISSKENEGTQLLSEIIDKDPRIAYLLTSKDVDVLIEFLQVKGSVFHGDLSPIQYHSAIVLTKLIAWRQLNEEQKAKAVNYLVPLLIVDDYGVRIEALSALTAIASKFPESSEDIIKRGALDNLMILVRSGKMETDNVLSHCTIFLAALFTGKSDLSDDERYVIFRIVKISLQYSIIPEVFFPLAKLSDGRCMTLELEPEEYIITLIEYLSVEEPSFVNLALEVVGNIVRWGSDSQIQCMIDNDVMTSLKSILFHKYKILRKEACWIISNIVTENSIKVIVDPELIDSLCFCLNNDDLDVKIEAVWAISNLIYSNYKALRLMQGKCMETLSLQQRECQDLRIANVCTQAIEMLSHLVVQGDD